MRKYWGLKAMVENGVLVETSEPTLFMQVGEMSDGTKVYEDIGAVVTGTPQSIDGKQYIRCKTFGKYLFYTI